MVATSKETLFQEEQQPPCDVKQTENSDHLNLSDLQKRLDDLTALVTDDLAERVTTIGNNQKVKTSNLEEIGEYLKDLKEDLNSIRKMRSWAFWVSIVYAALVNVATFLLLFCYRLNAYAQVLIPALVLSSTIGLFMAILRGTFKTYNERHKEERLPPHLQALINILKNTDKSISDK